MNVSSSSKSSSSNKRLASDDKDNVSTLLFFECDKFLADKAPFTLVVVVVVIVDDDDDGTVNDSDVDVNDE